MKTTLLIPLSLAVSGLIAVGVGLSILIVPHAFYASSGIILGDDATMLNEVRAAGGPVFAVGLFALTSLFRTQWAGAALATSATLYLAYGLSRSISLVLDGLPSTGMLQVIGLEYAVGLLCLYVLGQLRIASEAEVS